jgi:S-adenosylmethionine synthetase
MIDSTLKPWLIEINGPPQMTIDSDVDVKVKHPLIRDMIKTLFEVDSKDIIQSLQLDPRVFLVNGLRIFTKRWKF